ncbi:hypothetical protein [Natronobiforma cellulositropha]|uniref:hypothetical protein n=1 Tax=Natronobiforma cellulositropha TaxID=1679076 RepID=UPI0021D609FB|nr:hypothetical protein [Natronobiforma cellulositropha]
MVSAVSAVVLLVMIGVHTLFAAVATRFFRIRLETQWGAAIYTLVLIPLVLLASTLVWSGALGIGTDLGSREMVVMLVIALPLALGYTIDVFWMPHPDEVELPEPADDR